MRYRPRKEEYEDFMEEFSRELEINFPEICLGYFGSFRKKRAVIGRADIDGFLIMDSGVLSDESTVKGLSQILARALSNNPIKTQFNLLDRETIVDGRFASYSKDYVDYLVRVAKVVTGPEYCREMRGFHFKSGVLHSAAFNFSGPGGVRNTALYSLDALQRDYDEFSELVEKAIDKVAKFPKKLIWLRSGKIVPCRKKSQKILEKLLDGVSYGKLSELNWVLDDVEDLDKRLQNPEEAFRLLYMGLEVMEEMVYAYTHEHPYPNEREVAVVNGKWV
ncbi:hypothetical protein J4218_03690 [Candidatus Pacearchaeota archaeon]|nr:hypothetical protein [Candidatus Pacearchaeota archaeon]